MEEIDENVKNLIKELSSSFRCEQCGNCCNSCDIITVSKNDIIRLTRALKLPGRIIHKNYVRPHPLHYKDGDYSFINTKPCIFFDIDTKLCKIYDARPDICRVYPFIPDSFKIDNNIDNNIDNKRKKIHIDIPYNCPGYKELADKLNIKVNRDIKYNIKKDNVYQDNICQNNILGKEMNPIKPQIIVENYDGGYHNKDIEKARDRLVQGNTYKDLSTIIVIPTRGTIPAKVVQSWMSLMTPMNQKVIRIFMIGMEVGEAYNNAVEFIINHPDLSKWKYLLSLEEDNMPAPDGLLKLYEAINVTKDKGGPYDVVGALYWTKGEGGMPMIYGNIRDIPKNFIPQPPIPDTIQECNGLGMGMTLFRLDIFKDPKLQKPFFKTLQEHKPGVGTRVYTQDLRWFEDAGRLGYRFACATFVKVGHYDINTDIVW